jgi:acyl-homoserine lactone acylase PvdQ
MSMDSIGATVFSVWQLEFLKTLFHRYLKEYEDRMALIGGYPFIDFFQRLIHGLEANPEDPHFNKVCQGAFKENTGKTPCAYNMAKAFSLARKMLEENLSKRVSDWEWQNIHFNEFNSVPFSFTMLKPLFHRIVPVGGNGNTVAVSKTSWMKADERKLFAGTHTSTYRHII